MFENLAAVQGGNWNVVAIKLGKVSGPGNVDQLDLKGEFPLEVPENFQSLFAQMASLPGVEINSRGIHGRLPSCAGYYHPLRPKKGFD